MVKREKKANFINFKASGYGRFYFILLGLVLSLGMFISIPGQAVGSTPEDEFNKFMDAGGSSNGDINAILNAINNPTSLPAKLQVMGDEMGSMGTTTIETSSDFGEEPDFAALNEEFGRFGIFITAAYGKGEKDKTTIEPGFDFDTWTLTAGMDYRFSPSLTLGASVGFGQGESEFDQSAGDLETDTTSFSVFGTYTRGSFFMDALAGYAVKDLELTRNVDIPQEGGLTANINQKFRGDTDADDIILSLGAGYDLTKKAMSYGPFFRMNYIKSEIDGYSEKDLTSGYGEILGLRYADQEIESFQTVIGGQVSYTINTAKGVFVPQLRAEWVHEFKNDARLIESSFVDGSTSEILNNPTEDPDEDFFNIGIGVSATFPHNISGFVYYETSLGLSDITQHTVSLSLRYEF